MDFGTWLSSTQQKRDSLSLLGRHGSSDLHINKAIESIHEAEEMRDQAKDFLIQAKAQAMFQTRQTHPDLSNRERELIEKNSVRPVQAILDACETTVSSLTRRYFSRGKI